MQTPPALPDPQAFEDASQLRMLAIGHYVLGGLTALFSCFPLLHISMGIMMINEKSSGSAGTDVRMIGWAIIVFGSLFMLLGWSLAVVKILTGRWLSARKNRTFCFVVACVECIGVPLGTILGVFTITVLSRPSVRALFIDGPGKNNFTHM